VTSKTSAGVVCCTLGRERFAFRNADVRLVARAEQMRASAAANGQLGVIHHGGVAVPVHRLSSLLGLHSRESSDARHIVVTSGAGGPFGVLSDQAARFAAADRYEVLPLPDFVGSRARSWFAGMLQAGDLFCPLLSAAGIEPGPTTHERHRVAAPRSAGGRIAPARAADLIVTFRSAALPACDGDRYAICARQIAAVVQSLPSIPLPGASSFVRGVASWQGSAVPIVDFVGTGTPGQARHLIVRAPGGGCAALPVEPDITLRHASSEHRQLNPRGAPFVIGLFAAGDERLALIDVDALVAADERELIATCAG
jgi:chemotaxis signal transduction protein